ncbi:MAG: zinc-ribbon domain-containing protein [Bacilli bacterium]|jgi:uncharacterized protein YqhQ
MEETKFCPTCGKEVKPTDKFCPSCGASIPQTDTNIPSYSPDAESSEQKKEKNKNDDNGLASLICGIISLVFPYGNLIFAIIAISLSSKIRNENSNAKVGFTTGIIGIILFAIEVVLLVLFYVLWLPMIITESHNIEVTVTELMRLTI